MKPRLLLASVMLAAAGSTVLLAQTAPNAAEQTVTENLNRRFASGTVAVVGDKIITVADVVRNVAPLLPGLGVGNESEFQEKAARAVEGAIQALTARAELIGEFRRDGQRNIPDEYIDNAMADELTQRFAGDRSKFLEHLRSQGKTVREYRRDVEENIIYHYMRNQQRQAALAESDAARAQTAAMPKTAETDEEPRVHLLLIQLARSAGETDATLQARGEQVLARFKAGAKFGELARELSNDARRERGGDWGWLKRSDFKKEFSDIAFGLNKGEVSAPVILPEGAFILFVADRK